jgi:hypothetical protein
MASILPSRRDMRLEKEPAESAAFERGWRPALAYVLRREHLRRTVRIVLVVGIVLTTVNQLDVIVRGDATAITWIKSATNYVIPSSSPTLGCSAGALSRARRGLTSVR